MCVSCRWTVDVQRPYPRCTVRRSHELSGSFYSEPLLRRLQAGGRKVRVFLSHWYRALHIAFHVLPSPTFLSKGTFNTEIEKPVEYQCYVIHV